MTQGPDQRPDPLDDLKALMDQATPAPDPARKAATLARSAEVFEKMHGAAQGSAPQARPTLSRIRQGVGQMLAKLTTGPGLTATTALVAVGLVALVPVLREGPPSLELSGSTELRDEVPANELRGGIELSGAAANGVLSEGDRRTQFHSDLDIEFEASAEPLAEIAPAPLAVAKPAASPGLRTRSGEALVVAPPQHRDDTLILQEPNTEEFANEAPNPVKVTVEEPVSTFSIDVDTASYSVVRSSLMAGRLPPREAVRIEEMVNYFPYDYAAPAPGEGPFRPTVTLAPTPWNPDTQLMHVALQGELPAAADRPALNLVFLIDTSGSMEAADKLPLLRQSFRLMLSELSPQDEVSIVTYAGSAGLVLPATPASDRATILAALDQLNAGGSTSGQAGLQQAYSQAEAMAADGEVTRVILATDGDFNVGLSDPQALKDYIAEKRNSGTYLSVLGFGRGNLDDATMQALAQNGNGTAAYIDTLMEAQKVLVDQLTGALFPIANDVKIQVEFNPAQIAEYRLIGYETRALRREDFNNDKVDAGEIGAGHRVTALYELTPVGSPAVLNDPLRYAATSGEEDPQGTEELAFLRLRYKTPVDATSQLIEVPVTEGMGSVTDEVRFASAIAGFGQLLQGSAYLGDWSYDQALSLAEASQGADRFGYRREAVSLMRLAQSLAE